MRDAGSLYVNLSGMRGGPMCLLIISLYD
jgi:hypothetical protein